MGWIACEAMAKAIGESGKVLSLQGAQTSINGRERTQGFHDCITQNIPQYRAHRAADRLGCTEAGGGAADRARRQSRSQGRLPAIGLRALADAQRAEAGRPRRQGRRAEGHIYNISIDASPQALELIRSGDLDAGISQPLDFYAKYGVQYLQDALAGKELALGKTDHGSEVVVFNGNKMDLLPAVLVTKENVDDQALWGNQVK